MAVFGLAVLKVGWGSYNRFYYPNPTINREDHTAKQDPPSIYTLTPTGLLNYRKKLP